MRIGQICKKSALSKDTIRFYEKKGLLKVGRTTSEYNNYKNYTQEHLQRLEIIKKAKRFGFTLNDIADLLELFDLKNANCSILQKRVNEKIIEIDKKIRELQEMKNSILSEFENAQTKCLSKGENENCQLLTL